MKPIPLNEKIALVILLAVLAAQVFGGGAIAPSGPVHSILVHESGDDRVDVGALIVSLRNGAAASYFSAAGHRLSILDDDSQDENGQRVIPEADLQGVTMPAMLFYDASKRLVGKESLPLNATAQMVIDAAGRHGG